jgi:hypothetical protein
LFPQVATIIFAPVFDSMSCLTTGSSRTGC